MTKFLLRGVERGGDGGDGRGGWLFCIFWECENNQEIEIPRETKSDTITYTHK